MYEIGNSMVMGSPVNRKSACACWLCDTVGPPESSKQEALGSGKAKAELERNQVKGRKR